MSEVRVSTTPASKTEYVPSENTIPDTTSETKYREAVLTMKCFKIVFTNISIGNFRINLQVMRILICDGIFRQIGELRLLFFALNLKQDLRI